MCALQLAGGPVSWGVDFDESARCCIHTRAATSATRSTRKRSRRRRGGARPRLLGRVGAGVVCPLGEGSLDLDAVRTALAAVAHDGFATIEQDRRPGTPGFPADDLRRSVRQLREAALG